MVAGSALVIRYAKWRAERILLGSFALTAGSSTMLGLAPSLAAIYPAQLIGGMGNGL
jgi:predicted MFS family arabinose efflux permease